MELRAALCSRSKETACARQKEFFPDAEVFTDYAALLKRDDIEVLDQTQPLVWLSQTDPSGASVSIEFDIRRDQAPTVVEIHNFSTSNILFNGTVENPIGITYIENTGGGLGASSSIYETLIPAEYDRPWYVRRYVSKNNPARTPMLRIYGDVLYAAAVAHGAGLLQAYLDEAIMPKPLTGEQVNGFKVDFFWPELGLIVETDGRETHDTAVAFERDRQRDLELTLAGWHVIRITWRQLRDEPERVIAIRPATPVQLVAAPLTGPAVNAAWWI